MRKLSLILMLISSAQSSWASDAFFFNQLQNNANPFVRIHGLVGYAGTDSLADGQFRTEVNLEITNEFHQQTGTDEQINLDYERAQLNLNLIYGIQDDLSVGLLLPYISNSGGFMDSLIENWHDLFGLPQGGRDDAPRDEFNISYQGTNNNLLIDSTDKGIGDISLFLDKQLLASEQKVLKVRAQLKTPTGDEDQLFGSGGYAASISLHGSRKFAEKWLGFGMLGLTYLEDSEVLADQQNNLVGNAVLGITWLPTSKLGISAQLDLNSEVYDDTDLDALNGKAGVLNVSANYKLTKKSSIVFSFNEDVINKDAAPDFGINLGFQYQP